MTAPRTAIVGAMAAASILTACASSPSGTAAVRTRGSAPSSSPPATGAGGPSPDATPTPPAPRATELNPPGDIPDNQAYVAFSPAVGTYSVKTPEGWSRTSTGPTTSFTDKLNRIEVTAAAAPGEPTVASVTRTDVASLRAKVPKFALGKVTSVVRRGGKAILLTYQGDSVADQVTGKVVRDAFERYTFYRAGKRVDLTVSGPTNADNVDPWRIVSDSLRWL